MNPLIFQRPEFGRFFSLRSGNNRTKRTNWHPAALLERSPINLYHIRRP